MKNSKNILFLFLLGGLSVSCMVNATTIQNEISVKASTGGNSEVSESAGTGETSVFIETTVDGEVVQRIEETKQTESGESIKIEKQAEYISGEVEVSASGKANISEIINQDNKTVDSVESDSTVANQEVEENHEEKKDNSESNPLIARIVEWVQNIFSWFLA